MSNRRSHVGKSKAARERYSRYIKTFDYEPTKDEKTPFSLSDEGGEELKEPTSAKKRRKSPTQKIKDHFSENWIGWVLTVLAGILFYLMTDSKVNIASIKTTLCFQKEKIESIESNLKQNSDKNHEQDLTIREQGVKISVFEKHLNSKVMGNRKTVPSADSSKTNKP